MKKIAILSLASLLFVACNSNRNNNEIQTTANDETSTSTTLGIHNSRNSLNYEGVYVGELPTASGSGMRVRIELGNDTFKKEMVYNETNETFRSEGNYTWNDEGSIITLEGEEAPNMYRVGENLLILLDIDGNNIQSEGGLNYTLIKQ